MYEHSNNYNNITITKIIYWPLWWRYYWLYKLCIDKFNQHVHPWHALFGALQNSTVVVNWTTPGKELHGVENDVLFIQMNFNDLNAYWLKKGSACIWVTKQWETTLSCHSKNVLDLILGIGNVCCRKFIYWVSFKFCRSCYWCLKVLHINLQSAGVSFMDLKFFFY